MTSSLSLLSKKILPLSHNFFDSVASIRVSSSQQSSCAISLTSSCSHPSSRVLLSSTALSMQFSLRISSFTDVEIFARPSLIAHTFMRYNVSSLHCSASSSALVSSTIASPSEFSATSSRSFSTYSAKPWIAFSVRRYRVSSLSSSLSRDGIMPSPIPRGCEASLQSFPSRDGIAPSTPPLDFEASL
ncbi:hypothetical protein PIB30_103209 [Stylosanthes scabra]|uniref:Uncharacterized protein n=1 Tax=Stylosanthes scabra TaxID=79078 RepID=A0ABU6RYJ2_9FABA|nr:hypothetical protein [Stylosanthes scabra]